MDETKPGSLNSLDDIPEARREALLAPTPEASVWNWKWLLLGLFVVFAIAGGLLAWYVSRTTVTANVGPEATTDPSPDPRSPAVDAPAQTSEIPPGGSGTASSPGTAPANQTLLGHHAHTMAEETDLVVLQSNVAIRLKPVAAEKINAMIAQARSEGVYLGVVSGFRNLEEQRQLFFEVQAARGQTPTQRAEVSAPPGYSEHHTGYAVDFADTSISATKLQITFENTPAFKWLQKNAARYGFEMSFPKDNAQGVSYEPWHWRFVGDQDSLETFYKR